MEAFATLTTPHQNQARRPRGHEHTKLVELLGALCKKKKSGMKKSRVILVVLASFAVIVCEGVRRCEKAF